MSAILVESFVDQPNTMDNGGAFGLENRCVRWQFSSFLDVP